MRPGAALSTGCFALLSVWSFSDGDMLFAGIFVAIGLANLYLSLRHGTPPARGRAGAAGTTRGATGADSPVRVATSTRDDAEEARIRKNWRVIAIGGMVVAVVAALSFPPLALVLAACSAYAAHRARSVRPQAARPVGTAAR
ncbi:hypothetical protein [Georgenia sp. Z1491]|uniref:hypothetical protein n=1 Tax=Georgenia sp. Z1491 TaxID=3416707 RepID=UPI003CF13D9A